MSIALLKKIMYLVIFNVSTFEQVHYYALQEVHVHVELTTYMSLS